VLYVLLAQHLAPRANLDQPHFIHIPSAALSKEGDRIADRPGTGVARGPGRRLVSYSAPTSNDLTVAILLAPSLDRFGSLVPRGPASHVPTIPSDPGAPPSPAPGASPSPGPPVPPIAPPPGVDPPVTAALSSNHCGKSRGHRIHVPQGSGASAASKKAKGHVLHPCKSKGHGGTHDSPPSPEKGSGHNKHDQHAGDGGSNGHGHSKAAKKSHRSGPSHNNKASSPQHRGEQRKPAPKNKRDSRHKAHVKGHRKAHTHHGGDHSSGDKKASPSKASPPEKKDTRGEKK
jgi:hypothetical protein